jgi:hypothetical protein
MAALNDAIAEAEKRLAAARTEAAVAAERKKALALRGGAKGYSA